MVGTLPLAQPLARGGRRRIDIGHDHCRRLSLVVVVGKAPSHPEISSHVWPPLQQEDF